MGEPTLIFHITHVDNLPKIIEAGGLRCDRLRAQSTDAAVCIAHQHIKDRRARRAVPCAARGFVSDYVPFYFAPRSPMLYTINRGNVEGYTQGQRLREKTDAFVTAMTKYGASEAYVEAQAAPQTEKEAEHGDALV